MYCSAVLATVFFRSPLLLELQERGTCPNLYIAKGLQAPDHIIVIRVMYTRRKGKYKKRPVCKEKGNFKLDSKASATYYLAIPNKPLLKEWTIRTFHVKLLCKICNSLVSVIEVLFMSLYGRNNKVQGIKVKIDVNKQFHH